MRNSVGSIVIFVAISPIISPIIGENGRNERKMPQSFSPEEICQYFTIYQNDLFHHCFSEHFFLNVDEKQKHMFLVSYICRPDLISQFKGVD